MQLVSVIAKFFQSMLYALQQHTTARANKGKDHLFEQQTCILVYEIIWHVSI